MVMFDDPRGQDPREPRERNPPLPPPPAAPETWQQEPVNTPAVEPTGSGGGAASQGGTTVLPMDEIGDIPPPPIPPPPISGPGVAGIKGTEGGTFALPGTRGAMPFRTPAFAAQRSARFGPGVPLAGGSTGVAGLGDDSGGLGMSPEEAAELLRALVAGRGGMGGM